MCTDKDQIFRSSHYLGEGGLFNKAGRPHSHRVVEREKYHHMLTARDSQGDANQIIAAAGPIVDNLPGGRWQDPVLEPIGIGPE